MCIFMCVYCIKGSVSPVELSVVERVIELPQEGKVGKVLLY